MIYFIKSVLANAIRVNGRNVQFTDIGDSTGGLELEENEANAPAIKGLRDLAASRRGGVREVSAEEYDETKKKAAERELFLASQKPKSNPYLAKVRVAADITKGVRIGKRPVAPPSPATGVTTERPEPLTKGTLAELLKNQPAEPPKATPVSEVAAIAAGAPPPADAEDDAFTPPPILRTK